MRPLVAVVLLLLGDGKLADEGDSSTVSEVGTKPGQKRRRMAMGECCCADEDAEAWRHKVRNDCRPFQWEQTTDDRVEDSRQLALRRQALRVDKDIQRLGGGKQRTWDRRRARRGKDVDVCPSCDGSGTKL